MVTLCLLYTSGFNRDGQLGDGTKTNNSIPKQIGTGFSAVTAGSEHTVALKSDGSLWAWGGNTYGELGDGAITSSATPRLIGNGFSLVKTSISFSMGAEGYNTVALKNDGSLWAWGNNWSGQLGDGTNTNSSVPKQIGTGFSDVATSVGKTVAVKRDGDVYKRQLQCRALLPRPFLNYQ